MRDEPPPASAFFRPLAGGGVETLVAATPETASGTLAAFAAAGARSIVREGPRGLRIREAAAAAAGEILVFLHADTLLPDGWREAVLEAIGAGNVAGAFRLGFQGGAMRLAWVAFWANHRTALTRVPYGDQAPFVRRDVYERLGGHRPWPLLEDVELFDRVKRAGRVALLPAAVRTSPRRYLERGVLRTVLINWRTLIRYRLGVDPETLAREYRT